MNRFLSKWTAKSTVNFIDFKNTKVLARESYLRCLLFVWSAEESNNDRDFAGIFDVYVKLKSMYLH